MILNPHDHPSRVIPVDPFKPLIQVLTECNDNEFPHRLYANLKWERPRGNLTHWIQVLNRIDEVLEAQIKKYGLDTEFPKLHQFSKEDQFLTIACLKFTCTLLDNCIDELIYSSCDRIFDLIKTPTIDVRLNALEVMILIGDRYVQTIHSRYSAPKKVRHMLLQIAKSFPPTVPPNFHYDKEKHPKPPVIGDQHNYLDINSPEIPGKWRSLSFQYYKSIMEPASDSKAIKSFHKPKENEPKSSSEPHKNTKKPKLMPHEGLNTFHLSEEAVRKLSLDQIYDKATDILPESSWFEFSLAAAVAKAFNTNSYEAIDLRRKLLQIKFLAIGSISCLCSSQFTSTKLFEAEPYIFSFLVELIHPEAYHRVSRDVILAAVKALEYISLKKIWDNDIIRAIGGNVNHGTLFQCLKFIYRQLSNDGKDSPVGEYHEDLYIPLFNTIGNLTNTKSLAARLTSGGIIHNLMNFLSLRSKYKRTCSGAVNLFSIYLTSAPESLDEFINKNGFNLLIDAIQYEVDSALEYAKSPSSNLNSSSESSSPLTVHLDFEYLKIPYRHANYIRYLMELVVKLIHSDLGDRLRNLFDSHLLESFNKILSNPSVFGPMILSSTLDSVFYIIHNEPTAFSILNEAKVIDTVLDGYEGCFLPSQTLLSSLSEVISAICLNKEGLKKVIEKKTIQSYFKVLINPSLADEIVEAIPLGCTFDELGRHYPTLKPIILESAKELFKAMPKVLQSLDDQKEGIKFYQSKNGPLYLSKDEPVIYHEDGDAKRIDEKDQLPRFSSKNIQTVMLDNITSFLDGLLQDNGLWVTELIEAIDFDTWLDILTVPQNPFDYNTSRVLLTFTSTLKYFDDEDRNYGFEKLVAKITEYIQLPFVQDYLHYENTNESYFTRFFGEAEPGKETGATPGSQLLRALATLNKLLYTLQQSYINPHLIFHERLVQITEFFSNNGIITDLGLLLQRGIIEETILRSNMPDEMVNQTRPQLQDSHISIIHSQDHYKEKRKMDGSAAKFKNSWQIRHMNYYLVCYICRLFSSFARVCMNKRQDFSALTYRLNGVKITLEVSDVIKQGLDKQFDNDYYKNSYMLTFSEVIYYTITAKERNRDPISTALAFALVQNGVFAQLKNWTADLWSKFIHLDQEDARKAIEATHKNTFNGNLIKNGLQVLLGVFERCVNADMFPNIPVSKLYFHDGYEADSNINSSLLIQIRFQALELVQDIIDISRSCNKSGTRAISPMALSSFYNILRCIHFKKHEWPDSKFIPLDINNVSPPRDQLQYLKSTGMSDTQALNFFKYGLDLFSPIDTWPETPSSDFTSEEWDSVKRIVRDAKLEKKTEYPTFPTIGDLKDLRNKQIQLPTKYFFEAFRIYSDGKVIFEILELTRPNYEIANDLLKEIDELVAEQERGHVLAFYIQLLSWAINDASLPVSDSKPILEKFTNFIAGELSGSDDYSHVLNQEYMCYSLNILKRVLADKIIPRPEPIKHEMHYSNPNSASMPFRISDEVEDAIFESIISAQSLTNAACALEICKVLILYSEAERRLPQIAKSQVLKSLIQLTKSLEFGDNFKGSSTYNLRAFRECVLMLVRRCFESTKVIKNCMTDQLWGYFSTTKHEKDLHLYMKHSMGNMVRNPSVFIDTVAENLLIDGYDGSHPMLRKLKVFNKNADKNSEKTEEENDVKMDDAEASETGEANTSDGAPNFESTGIVHILLSELMRVFKSDWTSDPPKENEKSEENKESKNTPSGKHEELCKNVNYSYILFLLQTLAELLGSYKQPKLEFLTFSKKKSKDLKPRSTALNFFVHSLIPTNSLQKFEGNEYERRSAVSTVSKLCVLALLSNSVDSEKSTKADSDDSKAIEDPDMSYIRNFFVDILSKILKETLSSGSVLSSIKYGKLLDLFDLCGMILSAKSRKLGGEFLEDHLSKHDTFFISKTLIDKQIPSQITQVLSEMDLNFPGSEKVIKSALKPLTLIGKIKVEFQELFREGHQGDNDDDDIVPEDEDDREETPDLFRNSTLGMYDVEFESEEDEEGMDYFDDDPLEVLMSGEDISDSEDGSSGLSDLDSDGDEDGEDDDEDDEDDEMVDHIHGHEIDIDEEDEDDDSRSESEENSSGMNDIEIIDELNIGSHGSSEDEDDEDEDEEMTGGSDFYDFDDEDDHSEYDEEELDTWLEEFGGDEDDSEADEDLEGDEPNRHNHGVPGRGAGRNAGRVSRLSLDPRNEGIEEESNSDLASSSDLDSTLSDSEDRGPGRIRTFNANSLERTPTLAVLLDSFLGEGGVFRGTIEVNGEEHHIDNNGGSISRVFQNMLGRNRGRSGAQHSSEDPYDLYFKSTRQRWIDALNLFYPHSRESIVNRVAPAIINRIEEESIAVYKKKREESERIKREREEKIRKRQEQERKKEEEEKKAAEEAAAASRVDGDETSDIDTHAHNSLEPVMVRIGDRDVDISGTDIDPEFFEALPDDMREEVFTQHVRERRANATTSGTEAREIDPDFLDALPEHLREEILQQESMARRFSSIHDMRYDDEYGDDDEEDEELGDEIDEVLGDDMGDLVNRDELRNKPAKAAKKPKRLFFTPLVDRQGVSSLIRLLFAPLSLNQREYIAHTLHYLCQSKQTRIEVMGLLIAILHDGLAGHKAIEKMYSHVYNRCLGYVQKDGGDDQGKRKSFKLPVGSTLISIGIQMIEATNYLVERNNRLCYYLLTEHENPFLMKKFNRKNKLRDLTKENKYPINYLIGLLQHNLIRDDQSFMDILARVLQISTKPLHVLDKVKQTGRKEESPFGPPSILEINYRRIINLLTANECSNTTFRRTISTMQNLSVLPNAQKIFSMKLSDEATSLSQTIIKDLEELTKELRGYGQGEIPNESRSISKFSASSSDQAKLLRILTALDYMFESKEKEKNKEEGKAKVEAEQLTGIYKRLALGTLWDALSDCLRVLEERLDLTNIATALLPLIEALMVVCKHSKVKDIPLKDVIKYEAKKIDFSKEPIERLFFSFTDEHKKILNQMVRMNPNLMSGPFGMLVSNPRVLEFDNKRNYFDRKLHQDKNENSKLAINVRREQVFLDSYRSLFFKSKDEFKNSKLEVSFKGETGVDAGGVTREWYQVLSRQMFNPDYALFTPVASDETTFHPNRTSFINPEHLSFFKFIGRVIGKAIHDGSFLDCHFSRAVYKRILGRPVNLKDMETLDLEYFKSLMWMLENDITDIITEDFSVETDDYGEHKIIDLVPNGRNIPVTEENKQEYVSKVIEYRLRTSVTEQMENFLIGFHEIIPKDLVSIFDEQELELLISGLPDIDVNDWQNNSTYNNYSPSAVQIQWFWRAVKSFDNEERAKLLQFATGTSKVPLNGFKELSGANGACKFSIHRDYGPTDRLPSSHTCFNQIDLPAYESYEELRGNLLLAITEGHEGFGLA